MIMTVPPVQTAPAEIITLYYCEGSSDKVYQASIEPAGSDFVVNFAYGRRGSTMNTGTKTPSPVDYPTAKKVYDKLVAEKKAKGYTTGEEGSPYQKTHREERNTGILPQLLNPIEESEVKAYLTNRSWWAQEKLDGRRVMILRRGDQILGINRQGLVIALPEAIAACARTIGSQQWLLDGEAVGDVFHAFDILESACINLRREPYENRLKVLYRLLSVENTAAIRAVSTARNTADKVMLLGNLRAQRREGIVFKRSDAQYTCGRPASGGDQVKMKFTATASCIVAGINGGRRSVKLELLDGQKRVGLGSVSVPPNHEIPAVGEVVDVKYLYCFPGGSLFQPVYLGKRDDIAVDACTIRQLKFKSVDDEG